MSPPTTHTDYIQKKMSAGVKAYRNKDYLGARLHFQAALRESPENIVALLWLAYVASSHEKSIFLLERVLQIDPENKRAKRGLQWAKQQVETKPSSQETFHPESGSLQALIDD